jgi:hypothetical protein
VFLLLLVAPRGLERCRITGAPRVGAAITIGPRVGGVDHVMMEPGDPRPSFYCWRSPITISVVGSHPLDQRIDIDAAGEGKVPVASNVARTQCQ